MTDTTWTDNIIWTLDSHIVVNNPERIVFNQVPFKLEHEDFFGNGIRIIVEGFVEQYESIASERLGLKQLRLRFKDDNYITKIHNYIDTTLNDVWYSTDTEPILKKIKKINSVLTIYHTDGRHEESYKLKIRLLGDSLLFESNTLGLETDVEYGYSSSFVGYEYDEFILSFTKLSKDQYDSEDENGVIPWD